MMTSFTLQEHKLLLEDDEKDANNGFFASRKLSNRWYERKSATAALLIVCTFSLVLNVLFTVQYLGLSTKGSLERTAYGN